MHIVCHQLHKRGQLTYITLVILFLFSSGDCHSGSIFEAPIAWKIELSSKYHHYHRNKEAVETVVVSDNYQETSEYPGPSGPSSDQIENNPVAFPEPAVPGVTSAQIPFHSVVLTSSKRNSTAKFSKKSTKFLHLQQIQTINDSETSQDCAEERVQNF